ncbi:MAG TPA: HEAT repeat domain-containing protein [Vicinamibacteria bacterium]|nr:HEAT repeat domain-containing protein [Vicinamibacteria bacterium]
MRAQLERLGNKDRNERADAVMKLGGMGAKAANALPFLVEMVRDEGKIQVGSAEHTMSSLVAESLKQIDGPGSVPGLIQLLDDKGARISAATVLGVVGDSRATGRLVQMLADKDPTARYWAIFALNHIKDPTAVDGLAGVLRDTSNFGNVKVAVLVHQNAAEALGSTGDARAVPPLAEYLRGGTYAAARLASAEALAATKRPEAVDPLLALLADAKAFGAGADDVERFHKAAAEGLGSLKDARAIDPLTAYAKGDGPVLARAYAARSLGEIGDARVYETLAVILGDAAQPAGLRLGAAVGIERLGDPRAVEPMIAALGDKELAKVAARYLKKTTGQELGEDAAAWRQWLEEEKRKKAEAARPSPTPAAAKKPAPRKPKPTPSPAP